MTIHDSRADTSRRHTQFYPPTWVNHFVPQQLQSDETAIGPSTTMRIGHNRQFKLISVRVLAAIGAEPEDLHRLTADAYAAILSELLSGTTPHPIRFWNAIPGINDPVSPGVDRYMAFNAGRFEAFENWCGNHESFGESVATASGVGHDGDDLLIHCLASSTRGLPVENPRQIPSYHYSSRYGRLPPSFARATMLRGLNGNDALLLIGGTASICGEHSRHANNLNEQVQETLRNLRALMRAASEIDSSFTDRDADWLSSFNNLRVYYRNESDRPTVISLLQQSFKNVAEIEWHRADLCRRELLVEIEGVAQIGAPSSRGLNPDLPVVVHTTNAASAALGLNRAQGHSS